MPRIHSVISFSVTLKMFCLGPFSTGPGIATIGIFLVCYVRLCNIMQYYVRSFSVLVFDAFFCSFSSYFLRHFVLGIYAVRSSHPI